MGASPSPVVLHDQTNLLPHRKLLVVFGVMASAFFVAYADQNGVAVALPHMAEELRALDTISWAGTSAMIANTVFQVLYGRLSDIFGRKAVYLSALLLLAAADVLCATARAAWALYLFRGLAGVAVGGINSLTMMIVSDIVTLQDRGRYQGILGGCIGLGNTVGPLVSAAFVQSWSWRGFFYLIPPLMLVCCALSWFLLPSTMPKGQGFQKAKLVDWYGLFFGAVAIIFLLIPLSGGGSYFQWNSPMVISMLTIGGASVFAFVYVEWKVSTLPMVPMSMFKSQAVSAVLIQNFLFGYCYYASLYFLPLYYQNVRGMQPLNAALLLIALVIPQSLLSIASGFYITFFSRYGEVIWSGFICWTIAQGLFCLFNESTSLAVIIAAQVIMGVGVGNVFQPCLIALQAHSPKDLRAVVISNRNFLRALGGAFGLACSSQILQFTLRRHLPAEFSALITSSYALPSTQGLSAESVAAIKGAYVAGNHVVFVSMTPIIGLCLILCVCVKDRGITRKEETEPASIPPAEKSGFNPSSDSSGFTTPLRRD